METGFKLEPVGDGTGVVEIVTRVESPTVAIVNVSCVGRFGPNRRRVAVMFRWVVFGSVGINMPKGLDELAVIEFSVSNFRAGGVARGLPEVKLGSGAISVIFAAADRRGIVFVETVTSTLATFGVEVVSVVGIISLSEIVDVVMSVCVVEIIDGEIIGSVEIADGVSLVNAHFIFRVVAIIDVVEVVTGSKILGEFETSGVS